MANISCAPPHAQKSSYSNSQVSPYTLLKLYFCIFLVDIYAHLVQLTRKGTPERSQSLKVDLKNGVMTQWCRISLSHIMKYSNACIYLYITIPPLYGGLGGVKTEIFPKVVITTTMTTHHHQYG